MLLFAELADDMADSKICKVFNIQSKLKKGRSSLRFFGLFSGRMIQKNSRF